MKVIGMDHGLNGNRNSVRFCDADACACCDLAEGAPHCLRRKANFCFWLASRFTTADLGVALHKLSLNLTKDADALEREQVVLSSRGRAATS
jgi:hypothetical protein